VVVVLDVLEVLDVLDVPVVPIVSVPVVPPVPIVSVPVVPVLIVSVDVVMVVSVVLDVMLVSLDVMVVSVAAVSVEMLVFSSFLQETNSASVTTVRRTRSFFVISFISPRYWFASMKNSGLVGALGGAGLTSLPLSLTVEPDRRKPYGGHETRIAHVGQDAPARGTATKVPVMPDAAVPPDAKTPHRLPAGRSGNC
jgi:hypothetical protein